MDTESLREGIRQHLMYTLAKDELNATNWDHYKSVVLAVLDRLHDRWLTTQRKYLENDIKRVYYISMEYLIGRLFDNALINLGIQDEVRKALKDQGLDLDDLRNAEWDAGLGNGGLGRLAACFLDSMASLGIAGFGYGIRYDFGIFYQKIVNGFQVEASDRWLQFGNPWDVVRPDISYPVQFYGESVPYTDTDGRLRFRWQNAETVLAVAYDTPVPGFKNDVVNNLRLWKAESPKSLDLHSFNQGDYINAVRDMQLHENISRVLYPNDKVFVGQELRLKQEYFLVAATLADIIATFKLKHTDWKTFPDKVAIQCNDTHPNLAVAELMRILIDTEGLDWDTAWDITSRTIAYTNHTILPEALEKWPVNLVRHMLPRHMQIIYEINNRFLNQVRATLGDDINRIRRMSIIGEGEQPVVRMANLGIVGSHKVNGVSALHSDLIKKTLFKDFYDLWPSKFTNKTNGITPRRWLKQCNPALSDLITSKIGESWVTHLEELRKLEPFADDPTFQKKFADIKRKNKKRLAEYILEKNKISVNLDSIFDVQIKRIHEYKRQLLALLHGITMYNRIKADPKGDFVPRTILFAGKAAPGYAMAKAHIKLINAVGEVVNNDPEVGDKLKIVFLANYRVSLAELIIPACELSEQISTAGMEASGTGNMKFGLNGALTIGTLDGANVEMREEVGDENIIIFGHTVEEVELLRASGYNPWEYYMRNPELKLALDQIRDGFFSPEQKDLFAPVIRALLYEGDYFLVLADYERYLAAQKKVDELYRTPAKWNKMAILNTARMGKFSSDRTIKDYAEEIWGVM
jgi:starch phosphorylase